MISNMNADDVSGSEVVIVVEEGDEGQHRQDHKDERRYFEVSQLLFDVKNDKTEDG